MKIKDELQKQVTAALIGLGIKDLTADISISNDSRFGEYSTNVALIAAKKLGKSPMEAADEILHQLRTQDLELRTIDRVEVVKPGFINFFLTKQALLDQVSELLGEKEKVDHKKTLKKVMVEFTDPNPFKEFHIGHLYTNIVGESICRLLESQGIEVKRVCYQGDVGLHVAKAIWGMTEIIRHSRESGNLSEKIPDQVRNDIEEIEKLTLQERAKFLGEAYALGAKAYEEDEKAKAEIISLNKKVYEHDSSIKDLYTKGREWSLAYFEKIYQRLGTHFDRYYFESEVGSKGLEFVKNNMDKGIFEASEGAIVFHGENYGLHTRVFINSLGLPTYEAKELALAPTKYADYPYDLSIIITANEVNDYFKTVLKALSLINSDLAAKTKHLSHGMVTLPEGKMSSRTGDVITGEWLLDEAVKRAVKIISRRDSEVMVDSNISEAVGVGAVKYALLHSSIGKDIIFNFAESISLDGNSGPYLQYTYVRCLSILEKSNVIPAKAGIQTNKDWILDQVQNDNKMTKEELQILRELNYFDEIVAQAAKDFSPHVLCTYLFNLAQEFNSFYQKVPILKAETEEQKNLRLLLVLATAKVIKEGLNLLGIEAPERM
ncbi:MAG TPA: arginine--tRNA ligase [Patescibacteria group bacterium]|nr:arginine--tRNA ligase [Patescibacteria group bacterium]